MSRRIVSFEMEDDGLRGVVREDDGSLTDVYIDLIREPEVLKVAQQLGHMLVDSIDTAGVRNCDLCVGACCMREAHEMIEVTDADMQRLADHLGIDADTAKKKYAVPMRSATDWTGSLRLKKDKNALGGGCCVFLKVDKSGTGRCTVYEARPRTCRQFAAHNCDTYVPLKRLRRKGDPLAFRDGTTLK